MLQGMFDLDAALRLVIETEGSDLHLKVPATRSSASKASSSRSGHRAARRPRTPRRVFRGMLTDERKLEEFDARARGRLLLRRARRGPLPRERLPPARLDLDRVPRDPVRDQDASRSCCCRRSINDLADEERGIILADGHHRLGQVHHARGHDRPDQHHPAKHIVTIEDPVEFLHNDKQSIINQREVGEDTGSFSRALRRVLRQDPDVILIGEMRDEETVRTALSRGRDRPPRALDRPHGRRRRDREPHHRLLPRGSSTRPARCWPARSRA